MKVIFSLLFLPIFAIGQTTFTGSIFNKNTNAVVPYATIGLMIENIGVNADENGDFILNSRRSKLNDTVIVSSIGFITQKIAVTNKLASNLNIQLVEQIPTLEEIIIIPNYKWTKTALNEFSDCGNHFITSSGYLQQLAQHFVSPKANAGLTKVKICRMTGSIFDPLRTILRIRVYDIDTLTGGPGKDLCDKIIEIKSKNNSIDVDVEEYKIKFPHKDFFVALEWLKISYNEQKIAHKINGNDTMLIVYTPSIGLKDLNDSELEAWQLTYSQIWRPLSYSYQGQKKYIAISVIINY